jgi:hypothetical protein
VGCGGVDLISLAQDDRWSPLVNAIMKFRVP